MWFGKAATTVQTLEDINDVTNEIFSLTIPNQLRIIHIPSHPEITRLSLGTENLSCHTLALHMAFGHVLVHIYHLHQPSINPQ